VAADRRAVDECQAARAACQAVVRVLLEQRLDLLHRGWPSTNPLCELLDSDAGRWAGQAEAQRRALLALQAPVPADSDR
jgi:hypothetical protein